MNFKKFNITPLKILTNNIYPKSYFSVKIPHLYNDRNVLYENDMCNIRDMSHLKMLAG